MAEQHCGVIEKSTGDLLRAGYCDFSVDGSFDSVNEEQRTDIPVPEKSRGDKEYSTMHRWTGTEWTEVAQP